MVDPRTVAVAFDDRANAYNQVPPYHPAEGYPEYAFGAIQPAQNWGYHLIRQLFVEMQLDEVHIGTPEWNPLGEFVRPGDRVLLKPNLVAHRNWGYRSGITDTDCLVTHGSVIRAVADYVYIALKEKGEVVVGDSPVLGTRFQDVCKLAGLDVLTEFYHRAGLKFSTVDFRLVVADIEKSDVVKSKTTQNQIEDYVEVDLGSESLLMPVIGDWDKFAVTDYGFARMREVHNQKKNAYLFPKVVVEADCFVNLPKLKSHQKAGLTCSLKNLVGINGHKDYLPHFRMGVDEYPDGNAAYRFFWTLHHLQWDEKRSWKKRTYANLAKVVRRFFPPVLAGQGQGGWHANDTLWRTVLDINRAFFYFDPKCCTLASIPQRKYLTIIDGLIGGEKDSPLAPSPRAAKSMIGSTNPVASDAVAAAIMELDRSRIPLLKHATESYAYPLADFAYDDIVVSFNKSRLSLAAFAVSGPHYPFEPSIGWKGHVELRATQGKGRE